ncbi:hypothetical protein WQ57_07245 [Mesobacillus campisalis]|uniref:Uncharacterized protein n=1 Tax=Mesobacillus campisalis TaxID=1408103 RepID=A0A0M2SYI7_9BACI|nr:hypothetical protein WQ57_07245 [Mesobacillus campisalis]
MILGKPQCTRLYRLFSKDKQTKYLQLSSPKSAESRFYKIQAILFRRKAPHEWSFFAYLGSNSANIPLNVAIKILNIKKHEQTISATFREKKGIMSINFMFFLFQKVFCPLLQN